MEDNNRTKAMNLIKFTIWLLIIVGTVRSPGKVPESAVCSPLNRPLLEI